MAARGTRDVERSPDAAPEVPATSRLVVRPRKANKNRRRPASLWSRVPAPREIAAGGARVANACGRAIRRSLPLIGGAVGIVVLGFGIGLGYRFVTTSDRFAITDIQIHGTSHLAEDDLRAALPVAIGDNVFSASIDAIEKRVRTMPWIESVEARRVLPHTIVIDVREHEAAGVAALDDTLYLVDATGRPFKRVEPDAGDGAGLPIVTGLTRAAFRSDPDGTATAIAGTIAAVEAWRRDAARPPIGEAHLDAHRALTLVTYDGAVAIGLGSINGAGGDAELRARLDAFDAAWNGLADAERTRARRIHLDTPPRVTIAFSS